MDVTANPPNPEPMVVSSATKRSSMQINEAYESLEKMRRLNLELECQERGIYLQDKDYEKCTACLLQPEEQESSYLPSLGLKKSNKATPCLICATPCCTNHRSKSFWQESLVVCSDCEQVFTMEFAVECLTDQEKLKPAIERLMELYDRTLLLLQYSAPFVPEVCQQMTEEEKRQNRTSLGTTTVSVATGLVGAAAFVTPVGPPLLVGSLLFGTSATAVQVGSDARYFTLPAIQLANRILALYGMTESVLRIRNTLCAAAEASTGCSDAASSSEQSQTTKSQPTKHEQSFLGKTTGRLLKTGVGRLVTSATLSGAFLVWDTKNLSNTVSAIRKGNPCDKAERLKAIQQQIPQLLKTDQLDEELQGYAKCIANSKTSLDQETVMQIVLEEAKQDDSVMAAAAQESAPKGEPETNDVI